MEYSTNNDINITSIPKVKCANCNQRIHCFMKKASEEEINGLPADFIEISTLEKGEYLYKKGAKFSYIYQLRIGAIKNEIVFENGLRQVIQFLLPGNLLGLDGISSKKYQVDAISQTNSQFCKIKIEEVKKIPAQYPNLTNVIENEMGTLLNLSNLHVINLANLNAIERLADFLINYANRLGAIGFDRESFILPMNRDDLANYLGIKTETISRLLTQLEEIGAIQIRNRQVEIISRRPIFQLIETAFIREKNLLQNNAASIYPKSLEKRMLKI